LHASRGVGRIIITIVFLRVELVTISEVCCGSVWKRFHLCSKERYENNIKKDYNEVFHGSFCGYFTTLSVATGHTVA
jgi:hypothetical protein